MCDFKDAKVGDRVWSAMVGWAEITEINDGYVYPILVTNRTNQHRFDYKGRFAHNCPQSLFWDEVKITPPPKPKRKVKKVVEGWVNIYGPGKSDMTLHNSEAEANSHARWNRQERCRERAGNACFIRHEYEDYE